MKNQITLTYRYDDTHVMVKISPDSSLDEVLPTVEGFLRACTFVFDGTLQIVPEGKK